MQTMSPNLILLPHPVSTDGREMEYQEIGRNETLQSFLRRLEILPADPLAWAVSINGEWIAPERWAKRRLRQRDMIEMRCVAQGGDTMRMVGMLAIAVAAAYTGGLAAAAYGGYATAAGAAAGVLTSSAITLGGGMLLNKVMPIGKELEGKYASDTASATYSLSASSNAARPYEPMPLIIGTHRIKPDLASKPYIEQDGDDLYLLQAFHFGLQPDLDISEILIGDTPASDFKDVQIEVSGADGQLKLVSGNVDTSEGQPLRQEDGWISRTSPENTKRIMADMITQAYYLENNGSASARTVDVEIEYRPVGTTEWLPFSVGQSTAYYGEYWSLGRWIQGGLNRAGASGGSTNNGGFGGGSTPGANSGDASNGNVA